MGASAEGTEKSMHALEFKALLCVFCPLKTRPQMACKMYLSLLNLSLELPADAPFLRLLVAEPGWWRSNNITTLNCLIRLHHMLAL